MSIRAKVLLLGFALVCLAALGAYAQDQTSSTTPSLGDLARQVRAQKAKERKPAKVFTNDNLPSPKEGDIQVSSSAPTSSAGPAATTESADVHDEKYYRKQMGILQDRLDTDQRELSVLEQKLGQNNMQFYSNPQESLTQQYSRSDINKLNADIAAKKQQVADDQKAIDDLRDQLRREGGDPGWLR